MTSGQRKIHLMMWLVLGPIAVVGLTLAVVWRPVEPVQQGALPGASSDVQLNEQHDPSEGGDNP